MKPIKLTLEAFGPYLNETIDFTSFYQNHIFLISGKTGAGKTTIFDGMSYALFGRTNGLNREPKEMRSTFAKPTQETKVTFVFTAQNKTYQIERVPEQILAKKRGEGTREVKAKATITIYDEMGVELNHFSKTTEVNQVIQEVVQLEDEQFRQIIMLPQGDFRRFLNANSNEKEKILRKLFGTEPYRLFSEKLKEQKKEISLEIKDQEKELTLILNQAQWLVKPIIDFETGQAKTQKEYEALIQQQNQLKQAILITEKDIQQLKKEEARVTEKWQMSQRIVQLFTEKERLTNEGEQLKNKEPEIKQKKEQLLEYKEAKKIELNLSKQEELIVGKDELKKKLGAITSEKLEKEQQLKIAMLDLENVQRMEPEQATKKIEINQLEQQKITIEQLDELMELINKTTKEIEAEEKELASIKQKIMEFETEKNKKSVKLTALEKMLQSFNELEKIRYQLDANMSKLLELSSLEKQQAESELLVKRGINQLKELNERLFQDNEKLKQIKSDWAKIQILQLGESLIDGEPCPVCGSNEHPIENLGTLPQKTSQELTQELEIAEAKVAQRTEEKIAIEATLKLQNSQMIKIKDALKKATDSYFSAEPPQEINGELALIQQQLLAINDKLETKKDVLKEHQQIEKQLTTLTDTLLTTQTKKETLLQTTQSSKLNLQQLIGEEKSLRKSISTDYQTVVDIETALIKLTTEVKNWDTTYQEKMGQKTETEQLFQKLTYEEKHLNEAVKQNEIRINELSEQIQKQLNESIFVQLNDVKELLSESIDSDQLEKEIQDFEKEHYRISKSLQEVQEQLKNQEKPELELIEKVLDELEEQLEKQEHHKIVQEQMKKANQSIIESAQKIIASTAEKWQLFTEITNLSAVASGDGDQSKMGFERYVLTYFLEEVLIVANERLQQLTNNRYLFDLNREEGSRKTDTGLEINIYDDNAGGIRNVRTLSGGESFIAALSLSLSLSEVVQQHAGGIQIETMFIDEGFGSLDEDALEEAMDALMNIEGSGRLVGIISHVKELKDRIPDQLQVISSGTGKSQIKSIHIN